MQPLWVESEASLKRDGPAQEDPREHHDRVPRSGIDRLLLIGMLCGLGLMLIGGYALWVMPFSAHFNSVDRVIGGIRVSADFEGAK